MVAIVSGATVVDTFAASNIAVTACVSAASSCEAERPEDRFRW